jgi:hypothetical protein
MLAVATRDSFIIWVVADDVYCFVLLLSTLKLLLYHFRGLSGQYDYVELEVLSPVDICRTKTA